MAKHKKKTEVVLEKIGGKIIEVDVPDFLFENTIPYACYTIKERGLIGPDGLKTVQRRILYEMYSKKLFDGRFLKASTIANNVSGYLHPHAADSVSDTLARLGQGFIMRLPLIEAQGNIGEVTGDRASAPRYWEATLSKAGLECIVDYKEEIAQTRRNYTDTINEPLLIPIRFPEGIINGTSGIAVGFSGDIPPHNPTEVMNACIGRLKEEIKDLKSLMKYIKGPDFPTGGTLAGIDGVKDYLRTGNGTFIVRGKYEVNTQPDGSHTITIYELPYQVSPRHMIEKIRELQEGNKIRGIEDVKDLSGNTRLSKDNKNGKGLKLVIYVQKGTNPLNVVEELYKKTPFEKKISANMTVLVDNIPKQVGMIELIDQFLSFRKDYFVLNLQYKKEKLAKSLEEVEAILKVLVDIDRAVEIIKDSKDITVAKEELSKTFHINEEQAEYILQLRLRTLTQSDRQAEIEKRERLAKSIEEIETILSSDENITNALIKDLEETKKVIADSRCTNILGVTNEHLETLEKERAKALKMLSKDIECFVYRTARDTFIKSIERLLEYEIPLLEEVKTTSLGFVYSLNTNGELKEIPVENIPLLDEIEGQFIGVESHKALISLESHSNIFAITDSGNVGLVNLNGYKKIKAFNLILGESIVYAKGLSEEDTKELVITSITKKENKLVRFPVSSMRVTSFGSGVIAGDGNNLCDFAICSRKDDGLFVKTRENKIVPLNLDETSIKKRGSKGLKISKLLGEDIEGIYTDNLKVLDNGILYTKEGILYNKTLDITNKTLIGY